MRDAGGKAFSADTDIEQFAQFGGDDDGIAYECRIVPDPESGSTNLVEPMIG